MAQTANLSSSDKTDPVAQKHRALRTAWILLGATGLFVVVYTLLAFPEFQSLILVTAGVVLLIFGFFIVRQFSNYSLRIKFIVAFLLISIFSLGTIAFIGNKIITDTLTEHAGTNLQKLANSQAVAIDDLLGVQVNVLKSLSLSPNIGYRLPLANIKYGDDPAQIQAELARLDEEWKNAGEDSFLMETHSNNLISTELKVFQDTFPEHSEIFVTDVHGGILSTIDRTSGYYQADEDWWQAAYNNGTGSIYIGELVFDESSSTFGLVMAMPFYGEDGSVTGILHSIYSANSFGAILDQAETGLQDVHLDLLLSNNQAFNPESIEMFELETIDPEIIDQLEASVDQPYSEFVFEDEPSFVSQATVSAMTDLPAIANLGWKLIAHQPEQTALAPAQAQSRSTVLLGLAVVTVAIVAAVFVGQRLARPITQLTTTAQNVAAGDLSVRAPVESTDEVGVLAATFNSMTDQMSHTIDTLEDRVAARTRQLEAVVQISQRLSGILDLSDLLREVVTLTKETFGYYHVHIYLREEETLTMAEGYGDAGAEMKRQGHNIPLAAPQSLVARAAREGEVITVENVREDPDWLPNPVLPDTHSEMAIPVALGFEIVGVLDVQSEKVGGLSKDDESALQALANQVAVAVRNARIFTQTQDALYEAQRLQQAYTTQAWQKFGAGQATTNYEVRRPTLPPLEQIATPETTAAFQQQQTVDMRLRDSGNGAAKGESGEGAENSNALATPLKLRNQIIGILGVRSEDSNRQWTEDEIALIESVSEQMSLAIENARLFDDTQQRAQREALTREISDKIRSADNVEQILQTTVAELSKVLRVSRTFIDLNTNVSAAPGTDKLVEG